MNTTNPTQDRKLNSKLTLCSNCGGLGHTINLETGEQYLCEYCHDYVIGKAGPIGEDGYMGLHPFYETIIESIKDEAIRIASDIIHMFYRFLKTVALPKTENNSQDRYINDLDNGLLLGNCRASPLMDYRTSLTKTMSNKLYICAVKYLQDNEVKTKDDLDELCRIIAYNSVHNLIDGNKMLNLMLFNFERYFEVAASNTKARNK